MPSNFIDFSEFGLTLCMWFSAAPPLASNADDACGRTQKNTETYKYLEMNFLIVNFEEKRLFVFQKFQKSRFFLTWPQIQKINFQNFLKEKN